MEFLYPMGAWAAFAGLGILLLYMLRRQYTETEVPSTFLWEKTLKDHTVSRPIQKLKRNLLLLLQLFALLLLTLSLMHPVFQGEQVGETLMIFDLSASMQGDGRLEKAKKTAISMLESMDASDRISIFAVGCETKQLLVRSTDRQDALFRIRNLEAENGTASLTGAVSLAKAMKEEIPGLSVLVFSDSFETEDRDIRLVVPGEPCENRAVLSLFVEDELAVARIANYGADCTLTLELYADGSLADVRMLELSEGTIGSTRFSLPLQTREAELRIREADALVADNRLAWVFSEQEGIHVLLSGDGNIFWEKALQLRESLQLTRTSDTEISAFEGVDLYVQEGEWTRIVRDPSHSSLKIGEFHTKGGSLSIAENEYAKALTENMKLDSVYVKEFHEIRNGIPLFLIDAYIAASVDPETGEILLGFDLAKSNFSVKYDFPVFVQNVLDSLLPHTVSGLSDGECGTKLDIHLNPRVREAWIETPAGRKLPVEIGSFRDTGEVGIYTLVQRFSEGEERRTSFVLKIPETESDLRQVPNTKSTEETVGEIRYGKSILKPLLLLLFLVLIIEWGVSRFGRALR